MWQVVIGAHIALYILRSNQASPLHKPGKRRLDILKSGGDQGRPGNQNQFPT